VIKKMNILTKEYRLEEIAYMLGFYEIICLIKLKRFKILKV